MDDLISRQAAIDIVRNRVKKYTTLCVLAVTDIQQLPSAQPERKKGEWKRKIVNNGFNANWKCSGCGFEIMLESVYNFCPNCGADMRGEEDCSRGGKE